MEVVIPSGLSAGETAALLKKQGVIGSTLAFKATAKLGAFDRNLKPGLYRLRRNSTAWAVLRRLQEGPLDQGLKIVIPEGFSAAQIAVRLEKAGICPVGEFMGLVGKGRLEGYLFPTTYYLEPRTDARLVVKRMRQEFKRRIDAEYEASSPKPRLTLNQLLTLASIVEREAVFNHEKPMVAAVYLNRMRLRMRLEADPTVQYALGHWKKGLTTQDLKTPSPYNTYLHYGLPPGPICSPGLESFRAALKPALTDDIYFVADNTGRHIFSATHEEHLKAKRQYKRGLRQIKERLRREAQSQAQGRTR